ncbi:MAG: hypothetical protein A2W35_08930 [Chloroflexi bacterium RBG_16_57_11]|nr:MAG: hypothetical protein A2W35_08930 [Chloroflexi bacterium RBG_16_57_11]
MALSGQKTVTAAGTAEALGSQPIGGSLAVKALASNTDDVVVGNDGAGDVTTSNGFELSASEVIVFNLVGDLANIMVDAAVSGEGVCWITGEI